MKNIFSLLAVTIIIISSAFSCEKDDDVRPRCNHHKHHKCSCHHKNDKDSTGIQPI
jgi:hypothetical protein